MNSMSKEHLHQNKSASKVIVVGSGAAGLSAAIEASRSGSDVILLDKESRLGGNSAKATSGMNAVSTRAQYERGIEDSYLKLKEDTQKVGKNMGDPKLVDLLARFSTSAIEFLNEFGLRLTDISQCGGHKEPRTHRCPPASTGQPLPVGFTIIKQLQAGIKGIPSIQVITSAEVIGLLWEETNAGMGRRVFGVQYSEAGGPPVSLEGSAVVLATGGITYDRSGGSLLAEFAPNLCTLPTTSGSHADGKGIRMGREIGAELVHMDKVQIHPTGLVNPKNASILTKFLCPESLRGSGAIMVNNKGKRFVNELGNRAYVTQHIFEHCDEYEGKLDSGREQKVAYMILNEEAATLFGKSTLGFYQKMGQVTEFEDATSLCLQLGIPLQTLTDTLLNYTASATTGTDEFGKTVFPVKRIRSTEKLYVAIVTPVLHYTMGGLKIDSSAQVQWLRPDGVRDSITGLFAAGEVTGGVHGNDRLAGNSLLDCVVYGRLAGKRAATCLSRDSVVTPALSKHDWTPLRLRHKVCSGTPLQPSSGDLYELSFELPSASSEVGLEPGGSVEVRAVVNGEQIIRKYSPVSRPDETGHIDLWLRLSASRGTMSRHLFFLQPGETLEFRLLDQPTPLSLSLSPDSVHRQEEQRPQYIALLAAGPGIAPLLQVLREIVHMGVPFKHVLLVWAVNRSGDLIIFKSIIDQFMLSNTNIHVRYVVEDSAMAGQGHVSTGSIDETLLRSVLVNTFPTDISSKILICGSRNMCRDTKLTLNGLGYPNESVFSYL